jgi:histidinol-phosphatase
MKDVTQEVRTTKTHVVDVGALVDLALHMANRADEIALAGFGRAHAFEVKADGSPVTRIDREVESMLRDTIEREHPSAGVLGEEYGKERGVGRWVLDPIDGTREFVQGDPRFSVLIAYDLNGVPQLGVMSAPALGLRWWAGRGKRFRSPAANTTAPSPPDVSGMWRQSR